MDHSNYSLYASEQWARTHSSAFDGTPSSGEHLNISLQPRFPYSNTCGEFDRPHAGLADYGASCDSFSEIASGCYWEDSPLHRPCTIHSGSTDFQRPDISDATDQYLIRPPLVSPVSSEHHIQPKIEFQQQHTRASPQVEQFPETHSVDNELHDPHQLPSPAFSSSSLSPHGSCSRLIPRPQQSPHVATSNFGDSPHDNSDGEDKESSEPYAKLIYRALMSAPKHRMVLKDIYRWFERNTTKTRNAKTKGWQNSIRHNLSMNGVKYHRNAVEVKQANALKGFEKIQVSTNKDGPNKGWVWVLKPSAVTGGIQSTTRYRKFASVKKTGKLKEQDPTQIPRSITTRMATNLPADDCFGFYTIQQDSFVDSIPGSHFAGDAAHFEVESDYGVCGQLAELSPYYSLPGSPLTLACTHIMDFPSYSRPTGETHANERQSLQ